MTTKLQDLAMDKLTQDLLHENGRLDGLEGIPSAQGWAEVCKEAGYSQNARTPAYERYLDGWYQGAIGRNATKRDQADTGTESAVRATPERRDDQ